MLEHYLKEAKAFDIEVDKIWLEVVPGLSVDDDTIMGGYSQTPSPMHDYDHEICEYCDQVYDMADLHYVTLTYHDDKTVWRCEACRLDMKQYIVNK